MLNKRIFVDLHIHSKISEYKEDKDIVKDSTFDKIETLLEKLDSDEHSISMFSFTDHNRFDHNLYIETRKLLQTRKNKYLQTLIAGVEFDVLLEEGMRPCHIITIFDANTEDELKRISAEIDKVKLTSKDSYYNRTDYEKLITDIGLETLLIVCQRKDLSDSSGKHTSLSDSTSEPFEYIKFGYFNALEYQKPGVEGILRNNLMDVDQELGLVLGSDCHEWSEYPKHDKSSKEREYTRTEIKSLPSFKGLLLSLTSPKTRFKRKNNANSNYIQKLSLNEKTYELAAGINAIIGENGSGKSLLIDVLTKENSRIKSYYKKIRKDNNLDFDKKVNINRSQIVLQSEIIQNKYKNELFGTEEVLYKDVDDTDFLVKLEAYKNSIDTQIRKRIAYNNNYNNLANYKHSYDQSKLGSTFFISVTVPNQFEEVANPHKDRRDKLGAIITLLDNEISSNYYNKEYLKKLNTAKQSVKEVYDEVEKKYEVIIKETKIKNLIVSKINNYNLETNTLVTAADDIKVEYKKERDDLISKVIYTVKLGRECNGFTKPEFPTNLSGVEENLKKGFIFKRVANYHMDNLENKFYENMFNSSHKTYAELVKIKSMTEFAASLKGAGGNTSKINSQWLLNFEKIKDVCIGKQDYILDTSDNNTEIGNTLGEMSLVYYKYKTYNSESWDILVIDQPEDNISNPKIKESLIKYLNGLRDDKQIIFVTHNPLLVVNLDVDNLMYVEKVNNILKVTSGCLEDEENKILELVARNMDGGVETIEKRMKYYGKNN